MTAGGNLVTDDLMTTGGITVSGGDGIIEICGSSIGGALSVTGRNGDININNCDATDLTGGVVIELSDSAGIPLGEQTCRTVILVFCRTLVLSRWINCSK